MQPSSILILFFAGAINLALCLPTNLNERSVAEIEVGGPEDRGLYSDFYSQKMQTATSSIHSYGSGIVENVNVNGALNEDVGDKFTHAVVQTAVSLADTGVQAAHEILKAVGSELFEAMRI